MKPPRAMPFTVYAAEEEIIGAQVASALMASRGATVKIDSVSGVSVHIVNNHVVLPGINIWCATLSDRLVLNFEGVADELRIYFPSSTLARLHTAKGARVRDAGQAVVCWATELRRGEFDPGYGGPAMSISRARLMLRLCEREDLARASDIGFEAEVPSDRPGVAELSRFVLRLLEPENQLILSQSLEASESMSNVIIDMVLDVILNSQRSAAAERRSSSCPYYIRRCISLVDSLSELSGINVEVLARHAGVSKRTLQYGFRDFLLCSPHDFLRRERLSRARKALLEQKGGVVEIAERQGYSNVARFTRDFEDHFGVKPLALRRRRGE